MAGDEKKESQSEAGDGASTARKSSQSRESKQLTKKEREDQEITRRMRLNKLYRAPPTPEPEVLDQRCKSFILDNMAVSQIEQDYSRANPKHGNVIPPFNAQLDRGSRNYYNFVGIERTLQLTDQEFPGTSRDGPIYDNHYEYGAGSRYLEKRNKNGAGCSYEVIDGHTRYTERASAKPAMDEDHERTGLDKPTLSYCSPYGYRRNTPWLRQYPSSFTTSSSSSRFVRASPLYAPTVNRPPEESARGSTSDGSKSPRSPRRSSRQSSQRGSQNDGSSPRPSTTRK